MSPLRVVPAGDAAVIVEWPSPDNREEEDENCHAVALAAAFEHASIPGVLDIVPTLRTVAVYFDPSATTMEDVARRLERETAVGTERSPAAARLHRVPVCYGGSFGPDLIDLAATSGLSQDVVVARHSSPIYRVLMLGFMPGFAYMGPVDASIAVPRRTTPRPRVPSGSVAIAGTQTGIYPADTPGGWHVIGRTSVRPFDLARDEPFLFKAGDQVQFYPVEASAFASGPECLPST